MIAMGPSNSPSVEVYTLSQGPPRPAALIWSAARQRLSNLRNSSLLIELCFRQIG
jgi:hypothetical protein